MKCKRTVSRTFLHGVENGNWWTAWVRVGSLRMGWEVSHKHYRKKGTSKINEELRYTGKREDLTSEKFIKNMNS